MKKRFLWAVLILALEPVLSVVAAPRYDDTVALPAEYASRMAKALERITRAPRPDGLQLGDPGYPVVPSDEDLEVIRECVCIIKEQLDTVESKVCLIEDRIGDPCDPADESIDFCDCTSEEAIDNSNASVISYLRTILRELRGLVGTEDYCISCTEGPSELPPELQCP